VGVLATIGRAVTSVLPGFVRRQFGGDAYRVTMPATYYQQGIGPGGSAEITYSAVFAAIDRISSDIAKIPLLHWKVTGEGTRRLIGRSAVADVWNRPNPHQTYFHLMKAIVTSQLYRGNAYVFCNLNNRNQVSKMYCLSPDRVWPYVVEGEVFYRVARDPLVPELSIDQMVPARFMMHHRMETLQHPLMGVSPLIAAGATVAGGQGIQGHTSTFFGNMARPSGYLTTAGKLDRQRAEDIKKRWTDSYAGPGQAGRTAVLEQGLEYKQLTMTATDAQLIEQLRWTIEDIARVFQIPAFMIGDMTRMMAKSADSLTGIYHASCLGAHFSALENLINAFFELDRTQEYLAFDLNALFRTDFDMRVQGWAKAVQGGLASPNEGREGAFGFNPVPGGEDVFMQQQMVPITLLKPLAAGSIGGPKPAAAAPGEMAAALQAEVIRRLENWTGTMQ
jgi:HK97 family phage portal protein